MDTPTPAPPPHRFTFEPVEPDATPFPLDALAQDGGVTYALAMLANLRAYAERNPRNPWVPLPCGDDTNPDFVAAGAIFRAHLIRVVKSTDTETGLGCLLARAI